MKSVVLCEKPSVARDIARNLGAKQNKNGCLEGDKYVVTWALGHLVTLQTPDKYKEFNNIGLEKLPMIPKYMKTEVIKKTYKQYKIVENALNRKDVNEIIIATDAGREGELVARYILEKARCEKEVKRLWISSVTDKAIKNGFNNLKNGNDYLGLYHSGVARANADWLVGINASRALTLKYNASLNCGRVQTPTLQMVLEREEKIKKFKPRDYFNFEAQVKDIKFSCNNSEYSIEKAERFIKENQDKIIKLSDVITKTKSSAPKPLFNLTDIQQLSSALFGLSPKQTLNIVQSLYEKHKVLTYPRTDSRYLTSDMKNTIFERVAAIGGDYKDITAKLLKEKELNHNFNITDGIPTIILVVGVNGVGKTTSIGKLANKFKSQGKNVMLVAADTFRAAATEQLMEWANRSNVPIITNEEGADPASVVYDGIQSAKSKNIDVLICDTAGRLHNKKNLMNELNKITRIIDREFPEANKEITLVLDATTGQNAIVQAKEFRDTANIDSVILTKLDGTAKGGVVFTIQLEMGIPVKQIGIGERIDDLQDYNDQDFVNAIFR